MPERLHQLIVLGRGIHADGSLTLHSFERAIKAAEHYGLNCPELIVFSGGATIFSKEAYEHSEAEAMADVAAKAGVPCEKILLEVASNCTLNNFLNSRELLDPTLPTGIVAHADQMPRAMFIANRLLTSSNFEIIAGDPNLKRSSFERASLFATRLLLAGIEHYELEKIKRRQARLEVAACFLGKMLPLLMPDTYRRNG